MSQRSGQRDGQVASSTNDLSLGGRRLALVSAEGGTPARMAPGRSGYARFAMPPGGRVTQCIWWPMRLGARSRGIARGTPFVEGSPDDQRDPVLTTACTRLALLSRRLFQAARQPGPGGPGALAGEAER